VCQRPAGPTRGGWRRARTGRRGMRRAPTPCRTSGGAHRCEIANAPHHRFSASPPNSGLSAHRDYPARRSTESARGTTGSCTSSTTSRPPSRLSGSGTVARRAGSSDVQVVSLAGASPSCTVCRGNDLETPPRSRRRVERWRGPGFDDAGVSIAPLTVGSKAGAVLRRSGLSVSSPFPLGVPQ